ncbi:MAG: Mur ligase family protein [Peptococcaceae bacterium]|nr:Mur ligase family protein [Peptococcaceae bacterium]
MKLRFWLALWVGKIMSITIKVLGRKGTTFPGVVAGKICPQIIGLLAASYRDGTVIITGTNGKTTSNNLLASILNAAGKKVTFNREGANMLTGIAGALLQNASFTGTPRASLLLLEVDEATIPALCKQVTPRLAVITNFFRDQLDRYGELDTTVKLVKDSLPAETELILNADDPLVAQIGTSRSGVYYYGVRSLPVSKEESSETREGRYCAHCGNELCYELFHYGQLGIYECRNCGFKRPTPFIEAQEASQDENGISFRIDGDYRVALQGYYNLYNALAAFCAADRLGIERKDIRRGLLEFVSDAGRMEQFALKNCDVTLTLVKNPTGFNQVLHTLADMKKSLRLLIAINDLAADGRDISWLWDVDFEILASEELDIRQLVCSGLRAEDMALRLKYAGIPEGKILIEHSLEKAVELLETYSPVKEEALFILPTYTVLFPMRAILVGKKTGRNQVKGESA